ncbi:hypothetical protein [Nitrosococcus wardiae]|uniref:hypothetical protein n=1 Tax=Nitrosococcus wardiae TaxID=1814290 RepID=UPI00141BC22E|nr:hypothetical protein [Nitrosococcus wardiae]
MNNTETQTVQTVAKDQTIEDVVRESPVDQHELKVRKRLMIIIPAVILFLLLMVLL